MDVNRVYPEDIPQTAEWFVTEAWDMFTGEDQLERRISFLAERLLGAHLTGIESNAILKRDDGITLEELVSRATRQCHANLDALTERLRAARMR